jgi:hypothetical protein
VEKVEVVPRSSLVTLIKLWWTREGRSGVHPSGDYDGQNWGKTELRLERREVRGE